MTDPQVPPELIAEFQRLLQRNYEPVDLSQRPEFAPEHIETTYDMYAEMLDKLLEAHSQFVKAGMSPLEHAQVTFNVFSVSPLGARDVAALLSIAMDRMIRNRDARQIAENDWMKHANGESLDALRALKERLGTETNDSMQSQSVDSAEVVSTLGHDAVEDDGDGAE